MEPRKVQKVGYSTLSVSLPMEWAKKTGVEKGDVLFLSEENDGALRVTPEPTRQEDTSVYVVNVDKCDNTKVLGRVIVGNYVLGRNLIRVESERRLMREQIETIREVTQRLLGIGIIEESDRHLLLQCSIDPKSFPLETVIKRLYVITSIMFKEAIDALIDRDMELAKDAIAREHEADTIFWLLARLLASAQQSRMVSESIGIADPMEVVEHNLIAWYLEMTADRLNSIAYNIMALEEKRDLSDEDLLERLSQIAMICFTMFDQAMTSVFEKDMKLASDAVDLYEAVDREEDSLLREFLEEHDPVITTNVNEIAWGLRIISEYSTTIATISIDNVLKSDNEICRITENPPEE
ncbi:AbrB/MazE/SpoVT family DNA-binding domain-containing protein [Candidatus Bathyarchaeota archaeon]|nr:AbrB/MazE/SpoVT family DNA-binding domain-containing protein [Candidatus Bathyarchaeota archaeon]